MATRKSRNNLGPFLLFHLHLSTLERMTGRPFPMMMEGATGISHPKWRSGRALDELDTNREQVLAHQRSLLQRLLVAAGEPPELANDLLANMPESPVAIMFQAMGRYEDACAYTKQELARFDLTHKGLADAMARHVSGAIEPYDPFTALPDVYRHYPVGCRYRLQDDGLDEATRKDQLLALALRANMALSFLALLDHEMLAYRRRLGITHPVFQQSLFATLLTPPPKRQGARSKNNDPVARLVDLIGWLQAHYNGRPQGRAPLSLKELAAQVERSGAHDGDAARYVRGLRNGEIKMSSPALRAFISTQLGGTCVPTNELYRTAATMDCFLYAAHMFSLLMPDHLTTAGHLDRTGWRDAYLGWWDYHRPYFQPITPAEPAPGRRNDQPPKWLVDPT